MSMKLYAHPFSSYCQKVLIALYENDTPFEFRMLAPGDERAAAEHAALWPLKRMPVLVDDGRTVVEASIIIEHLGLHHPGPVRLIPEDPRAALEVRMMDRFFDNYVMTPMQKIVRRQHPRRRSSATARGSPKRAQLLDTAYRWLDDAMSGREWAAGDALQPRRLRRRPRAVLRRLGPPDRRGVPERARLSAAAARAAVVCARGGRGAAVSAVLPARRARP